MGLDGWVENAGSGVEIHVEGPAAAVETVPGRPAGRAAAAGGRSKSSTCARRRAEGRAGFEIRATRDRTGFVFISPDIATCPDCLEEIGTPGERRFRYAFTNCTNCGPRYTIVRDLPYDRPRTTMAGFAMCPDCRREYEDPLDRRHHAQPIACPACGPRLSLLDARSGRKLRGDVAEAAALIKAGRILAVKGLGGFHLVCDPFNRTAVARLRRTKDRRTKPLALMARDLAAVRRFAVVSKAERRAPAVAAAADRPAQEEEGHPGDRPRASTRSASCSPTRPSTGSSSRTSASSWPRAPTPRTRRSSRTRRRASAASATPS